MQSWTEVISIHPSEPEQPYGDDNLVVASVPRRTLRDRLTAAWRRHGW
jgi:hypothetical protein